MAITLHKQNFEVKRISDIILYVSAQPIISTKLSIQDRKYTLGQRNAVW
jgi:hypothetical protein